MKTRIPLLLVAVLMAVLPLTGAHGQYFGQNKVQYKSLQWSIIKTPNFHLYFHDGERRVALDMARMAERAYTRLSKILDHEVGDPIPIILHASHAEFARSNISAGIVGEGTGGYTEFLKRRVTLPVTGSYADDDHVLTHELVHAFQIDMLTFGGSSMGGGLRWAPPLWIMEGMAEYLSLGEIDEQTQMWLRDGALEGYLIPVKYMDRVADIRVYRYGQAIMSYIGATYGDEKIGQLFKKMAATRLIPRSFEETLGVTLDKMSDDWTEYVRELYLPVIDDHDDADEFALQLTHSDRELSNSNLSPAISADGQYVTFFSDRSLYNDLYLASAVDGTLEKRLIKGERSADFESLRYFRSTVDWSPDGESICFIALAGGNEAVYVQRVRDGKILEKLRTDLDGVITPSFSPDGEWIVFSGIDDGSSNLYRVRVDGEGLEQLTDDRYMVREPRYSPDGTKIIYVTDRGDATDFERLIFSKPVLATFDLQSETVEVLPGQSGRNISPHYFPDGEHILFVSDRSGIANIFIRNLASGEDRQVTNILSGVSGVIPTSSAVTLSRTGNRLVFGAFQRGSFDLYAIKDPLNLWDEGRPWDVETDQPLIVEDIAAAVAAPELMIQLDDGTTLPQPDQFLLPEEDLGLGHGSDPGEDEAAGPAPTGIPVSLVSATVTAVPYEDDLGPGASTDGDVVVDSSDPDSGTTDLVSGTESGSTDDSIEEITLDQAEVDARLDSLWASVQDIGVPDAASLEPDELPVVARRREESLEPKPIAVKEVFAENADLPDPSSFKVEKYKAKFSADYVAANGFFANNVGVAAQSTLQFSDILGEQRIIIGANVYGSFKDSDLLLGYTNLKRRTNWGVSVYQYRNDYYLYTPNNRDDYVSQIYRGVNLSLQRPFDRFRRVEFSLSGQAVSESVYEDVFFTVDPNGNPSTTGTLFYIQPGIALVNDRTLYGYTGPISGGRDRFSFDVALGDLQFTTLLGDVRRYYNLRHQYALAVRGLAATSDGRHPRYFQIGGPFTLRGYGYGQFRGTKIALANVEFRFPLIQQLALGWPLPLVFQGVRGAVFFDVGSAWTDTNQFQPFESHGGLFRLNGLHASYGISTSVNLGFSVVKWDLAWLTDLSRNTSKPRGWLSFGFDF